MRLPRFAASIDRIFTDSMRFPAIGGGVQPGIRPSASKWCNSIYTGCVGGCLHEAAGRGDFSGRGTADCFNICDAIGFMCGIFESGQYSR
jgi:hypothetical protein